MTLHCGCQAQLLEGLPSALPAATRPWINVVLPELSPPSSPPCWGKSSIVMRCPEAFPAAATDPPLRMVCGSNRGTKPGKHPPPCPDPCNPTSLTSPSTKTPHPYLAPTPSFALLPPLWPDTPLPACCTPSPTHLLLRSCTPFLQRPRFPQGSNLTTPTLLSPAVVASQEEMICIPGCWRSGVRV